MTAEERSPVDPGALAEAVRGTRAMVGVIAQSLIPVMEQVTMPQFRALVLLRALGPTPAGALAARIGVTASTGTRLVARLVRGGWVERRSEPADRLALADGVWAISPASSSGVLVLGLPLEEGLFFVLTTALVADGLLLAVDPRALARARALVVRRRPAPVTTVEAWTRTRT